jgi:hypothetical protein
MEISRRQLVALGATGAAGAIVGKVATSESAAAAGERMGGIHISALTKVVDEGVAKEFPHHWTMTVYGPDNALNGMGWGGATDLKGQQAMLNSRMFQCVFSLTGAVEGDVVKMHGLMLMSGSSSSNPDEGQPLFFEAKLGTGFLHVYAPFYNLNLEGTGVVARI